MKFPPPPSKSAGAFVNAAPPRFDPFSRKWHEPESTIAFRALFSGLYIFRTAAPNCSGFRAMDLSALGLDTATLQQLLARPEGALGTTKGFSRRLKLMSPGAVASNRRNFASEVAEKNERERRAFSLKACFLIALAVPSNLCDFNPVGITTPCKFQQQGIYFPTLNRLYYL